VWVNGNPTRYSGWFGFINKKRPLGRFEF